MALLLGFDLSNSSMTGKSISVANNFVFCHGTREKKKFS